MLTIQEISTKIKPILDTYPIRYAGVFGSYAQNSQKKDSDIDILISFKKPITLTEFIKLKQDLKKLFKKDVDVVSDKSILSEFKTYIYKDLVKIYD